MTRILGKVLRCPVKWRANACLINTSLGKVYEDWETVCCKPDILLNDESQKQRGDSVANSVTNFFLTHRECSNEHILPYPTQAEPHNTALLVSQDGHSVWQRLLF